MRMVFVGSSKLTLATVHLLIRRGHELILIERDKDRIESLAEELDCGFLHGDGSKPTILREAIEDYLHQHSPAPEPVSGRWSPVL